MCWTTSTSTVTLNGARGWLQLELLGGDGPLKLDSLELAGLRASADAQKPAGWSIVVTGSDDGLNWTELGRTVNPDRPPAGFRGFGPGAPSGPPPVFAVAFTAPSHSRRIRIELSAPSATRWTVADVIPRYQGARVEPGGPYNFTSAWMSGGRRLCVRTARTGQEVKRTGIPLPWIIRRLAERINVPFPRSSREGH